MDFTAKDPGALMCTPPGGKGATTRVCTEEGIRSSMVDKAATRHRGMELVDLSIITVKYIFDFPRVKKLELLVKTVR